jgi:hypothetical protein
MPETRWLDFSGAPPLIIPRPIVQFWRGTTDPSTGEFRVHNPAIPVTDYDRACLVALPGKAILEVEGLQVLSLHSGADLHSWGSRQRILACGSPWPSGDELRQALWTHPVRWHTGVRSLVLMNSAVDGSRGLWDRNSLRMSLAPGDYIVTSAQIGYNYFHRFTRTPP